MDDARQVALAVPLVRDALLAAGGNARLAALVTATGLPFDVLLPALGELFETHPGKVDVDADGEFFIALEAEGGVAAATTRQHGRLLGGLRGAMYVAFGLYSALYAGALVLVAAGLSGQASVLRWAARFVRGDANSEPRVPSLRDRLVAFFLGPEGLLPDQWEADRTALHASRLRDRTLTPVDLIAIFGYDRARAEAEASRIAFQHGGGVEHEDGRIWFTFPGFPELTPPEAESARRRVARGATDDVARRLEVLRRDRVALVLGFCNLAVAALLLSLISHPLWRLLFGWLPLGLSSGLLAHAAFVHLRRGDTERSLRRQAVRAELVRELLHGEGLVTRPVSAPADEREVLLELARELGGQVATRAGVVEGRFDEAYRWTMQALESAPGDPAGPT